MDIVVLCGGLSAERDVSLSTGALAAQALLRLGHRVVTLDLFFGCDTALTADELFASSYGRRTAAVFEAAPDLAAIRAMRPGSSRVGERVFEICAAADLVFMALHGADGEDGKIQAAFELLGIKYTGTGSLGSALAMNKAVAKKLLDGSGIRTARGIVLDSAEDAQSVGFPCVVKPCSGGSSVGTTILETESGYRDALKLAFLHDTRVIVEQYIKGRECAVGVLSGRALPVIEIVPKSGFYDYKTKYQMGLADEICPAPLPADITVRMQSAAVRVFDALQLEVYARIDFIVDGGGEIWCLEANTLPGLTPTSLLPQEAAAIGMDYDALVSEIVRVSLDKYGDA